MIERVVIGDTALELHHCPARERTVFWHRQLTRTYVPDVVLVVARRAAYVRTWVFHKRWRVTGVQFAPFIGGAFNDGSVCFGDVPREVVEADPVSAYWNSGFSFIPRPNDVDHSYWLPRDECLEHVVCNVSEPSDLRRVTSWSRRLARREGSAT